MASAKDLDGSSQGRQVTVQTLYSAPGVVGQTNIVLEPNPRRVLAILVNKSVNGFSLDLGPQDGTGAISLGAGDTLILETDTARRLCEWTGPVFETGGSAGAIIGVTEVSEVVS